MATPYKFLDNYEFEDAEIFFGRDLEVELLLSDVISTRLVLLFAKTGSGKTSLINAGVRPRLEKLDYKTFFVRVEGDPTESVRQVLANQNLLPSEIMGKSLEIQLEYVVNDLKKPIVLFFDQFEEFFIHILDEVRRKGFIASMGSLYRDRDSGVHLVFSFREEFFVEMGEFRPEIPTVFHNDSNLRLGWFTDKQAEDVILKPLQLEQFKTKVEGSLVKKLLVDLRDKPKGIEPPRLQVVCDTLWRERTGGEIRLQNYERLGGATQIIDRRLEEDIDKNLTDEQLSLFERLLPLLRTQLGLRAEPGHGRVYDEILKSLKQGRTLDELSKTLKEDADRLRTLLELLKQLHFIKQVKRHDGIYFEWTSDYLADRSDSFHNIVRTLIVERLLRSAMQRSAEKRKKLDEESSLPGATNEPLTDDDIETLYLSSPEIEAITRDVYLIRRLSKEEAEFMLVAALEHGLHMSLWFAKAEGFQVDVWEIINKRITNDDARIEQAENTVRLLGEIGSEKAFEYLRLALHQEALASLTVYVLGEKKTDAALDLYREALQQGILIDAVIDQLSVATTASALDLLLWALKQDELSEPAARALEKISKSRSHPFATQARTILEERSRNEEAPTQPSKPVEEVWRREPEPFDRRTPAKREYVPPRSDRLPELEWRHDLPPRTKRLADQDWALLIARIRAGKCTPFIGDGTSSHYLPSTLEIAQMWANEFRYPLTDSTNLSRVAQFLSVRFDPDYARQLLREIYLKSPLPDFADTFNPYTILANLPFPIYVATTYDAFLIEALKRRDRDPKEFYLWNRKSEREPDESYFRPTVASPAIFYLYGNIEDPDSMAITIDDFFHLLTSIERDKLIPPFLEAALVGTSYLLLGYSITDISFQFLYHFLTYYMQRSFNKIHVSVQLTPLPYESPEEQKQSVQDYLRSYFELTRVKVYWGTSQEFTRELRDRWEDARF